MTDFITYFSIEYIFDFKLYTMSDCINLNEKNVIYHNMHISFSSINDENGYVFELINKGNKQIKILSIEIIFDISDIVTENTRIFQNGYQSWSPTGSVTINSCQRYSTSFPILKTFIDQGTNLHNDNGSKYWQQNNVLISNMFTILNNNRLSEHPVLFGFDNVSVAMGEFIYMKNDKNDDIHSEIIAYLNYGNILEPLNSLITPTLLIIKEDNCLERFTEIVKNKFNIKIKEIPVGWCSWYSFDINITETNMIDNIQKLKNNPLKLDVKYIQLDDGYYKSVGDWLDCNNKFPNHLKHIVNLIHENGMNAGIWIAPFLVGPESKIYKKHKDWLLRDKKNNLIVATYNPVWKNDSTTYALDGTNPKVQEHLFNIFFILRNIGFNYFKLDFLAAGNIQASNHYNKHMTRTEAYCEGLRAIRKGAGDNAFILGCGALIGASIGLVDGMRVSPDTADSWSPYFLHSYFADGAGLPSTSYALQSNISRQFMNKKWWINDPDVLILRDHSTSLTEEEIKTKISIIGMLGGSMFFSDELYKIGYDRINMMRKFLPITNLSCTCVDILESSYGSIFLLNNQEKHDTFILTFLNWTDKNKKQKIDDSKILLKIMKIMNVNFNDNILNYYDFWENNILTQNIVNIKPHGVKFLIVTLQKHNTMLLGNNLNPIAQIDGRLQLRTDGNVINIIGLNISLYEGSIWINCPNKLSCVDIISTSHKISFYKINDNKIKIVIESSNNVIKSLNIIFLIR